jgi:acetyl esterase/lipase
MLVSWLFLAAAVWGALWTLASFRPPQRPGWLLMFGFFAAWWTTELAPLHLLWQLAAVVVFVALGALNAWPGWVALAITVASWCGLVWSVRGSWGTDRTLASSFRAGLGPGWDAGLSGEQVAAHRRKEWARVLLPFWFKRRGVKVTRNIQYVAGDTMRRHRLDVYKPVDAVPGAPVILQIHGGGWVIGNKNQQGLPLMYHLASHGWVCVAINYRLSPRGTWPDHLVDCKHALAWIRNNIAEHGGDPNYVVVTGGSAGGHLTAMMGLTPNAPEFQPGFEDVDTTVRAIIPFYAVYDWTQLARKGRDQGLRDVLERYIVKKKYDDAPEVYANASPVHHIRPDAPPALIVHGDRDTLAPVAEARTFVEKLRASSHQPVVYVELKGAEHAFEVFNSLRTMEVVAGVDRFLTWLVAADPPAGPSPAAAVPTDIDAADGSEIGPRSTVRTEP